MVHGQSCKIAGNVLDTLGQPIEGAVVISMEPLDSVMVEFASTDEKGHFRLGKFKNDSLLIQVSFLGFAPYYQIISCQGEDLHLQVKMQPEDMFLQTVVVREERIPVKMNGDTVQYDARAFRVKPGDVTEDLLKKMPGIEVDENGGVTAMGKKVSKILVDGKEFFGSDPKMATKNIPADAIKNVKVYDKKTDNETFTKTDDGQEDITIDLELKEDKKVGGFGRVTASGGTQDRYAAKGNYFRFAPKIKYSLIGMSNNTNQTGYSIGEMIEFRGGMSVVQSGRFKVDDALPFVSRNQDGFLKTHSGAGSFSFNDDKWELNTTLSALGKSSVTKAEQEVERFLNAQEKYSLNKEFQGSSSSEKYLGRMTLKYKIDSTQEFSVKGTYQTDFLKNMNSAEERKKNEAKRLVSRNDYDSGVDKFNTPFSGKMTYRKRFKNNHTLIGSVDFRKQESIDDQSVEEQSVFYDTDTTETVAFREINKGILVAKEKERLGYTLPSFKENKLEIWGTREVIVDDQKLDNKLFNGLGFERIDSLSGSYKRDVKRYQAGLRQDIKVGKTRLSVGLGYEQSTLGGAVGDAYLAGKKYLFFMPSLKWQLKISGSSSLRFTYRSSQILPDLKEILPVVEVHSASYTYRGNPSLKPSERHQLRLTYRNFDRFNGRTFFGFFNLSYYKNPIVNARNTDAFYRQEVMPVNTPKKIIWGGNVYYQMKIPALKAKLNLNGRANLMHGKSVSNDQLFSSVRKTYVATIGIENSKKKIYDFGIKTTMQLRDSETEIKSLRTTTYSYTGHFSVVLPKGFEFETKGSFRYYPDTRFESFPPPSVGWTLSKTFTESKKWLVALSGYDLAGRSDGYKQNAGIYQVSTTRTENVGRYFLLKVSYRI